tara:strand:+ start:5513 stop:5920 length:408 start_codon:yes stop_codon:yes gene_type:complete
MSGGGPGGKILGGGGGGGRFRRSISPEALVLPVEMFLIVEEDEEDEGFEVFEASGKLVAGVTPGVVAVEPEPGTVGLVVGFVILPGRIGPAPPDGLVATGLVEGVPGWLATGRETGETGGLEEEVGRVVGKTGVV